MRILCGDLHIVLDARELSKLALNDDIVCMGVLDDALRKFDVLLEAQVRAVDHDGGEAAVDAGLANVKVRAVIEVQCDGNIVDFKSCLDEMDKVLMTSVLACTRRDLQDQTLKAPMAYPPS